MISKTIAELIYYAEKHLYLLDSDKIYFTNILLHFFGANEPYEGEIDKSRIDNMEVPDEIVSEIFEHCLLNGDDEKEAERKADFALGIVSPLPSLVNGAFEEFKKNDPATALQFLKALGTSNYYFQKTKVERNKDWTMTFEDGPNITLSINLSKPEKNNKDIAKLLTTASTNYPKCALCVENLGFYGDDKHAARMTIRYVPLDLAGERWYLQYSPYGYFRNHCICFKEDHIPMKVERKTFDRLLSFVEQFPSFFMGSNSDLPIVGGSILNHEHFQGGSPVLPLFASKDKEVIFTSKSGTKVAKVDSFTNTLRISGKDKEEIMDLGEKILNAWRVYDNEELGILHETDGNRHNTVTSYAIKNGEEFQLIIVLRCNITSEQYPDGVFHAHPEYHAIKKEGIGLIECAGEFVLPARLERQIKEVEESVNMSKEEYLKKYPDMSLFEDMITAMKENPSLDAASYIGQVCRNILRNVAVFKDDEKGQQAYDAFLKEALK